MAGFLPLINEDAEAGRHDIICLWSHTWGSQSLPWHRCSDCRGLKPVHPSRLELWSMQTAWALILAPATDDDSRQVIALFAASVSPSV